MISPVELFVGLRYLRAKRRTRFVSFITLISLLGVALGVAADQKKHVGKSVLLRAFGDAVAAAGLLGRIGR